MSCIASLDSSLLLARLVIPYSLLNKQRIVDTYCVRTYLVEPNRRERRIGNSYTSKGRNGHMEHSIRYRSQGTRLLRHLWRT